MKIIRSMPLVLILGCSTAKTPPLAVKPQEASPSLDQISVRYPEGLRAYYVGRYADPNNSLLLHEQHVVYRVEVNSRWNLHPGPNTGGTVINAPDPSRDPAFAPLPVNDAILAEVNTQKAATTAMITQARQLTAALEQFQNALRQTKANLQETAAFRAALKDIEKRIGSLETEQQRLLAPPVTQTGEQTNSPANQSP